MKVKVMMTRIRLFGFEILNKHNIDFPFFGAVWNMLQPKKGK